MKSEKQLYQWDTNQSLVELTPSAQFVDYPIGDEVIRIKADGKLYWTSELCVHGKRPG